MLQLEEDNIIKSIIELLEGNKIQILKLQKCSSEDFLLIASLFKNNSPNNKTITVDPTIVSCIIKDLQYQDAMRQKLEHIETIDDLLLKELKQSLIQNGDIIYCTVIREIITLNIAQLKVMSEEYRLIVENLQKNIQKIETKEIVDNSYNISKYLSQNQLTDTLIKDIIEKHTLISKLSLEYKHKRKKDINAVLLKLRDVYTMQSERDVFNKIFEKEIRNNQDNQFESNQENNIEFF
ncbi:hypothetical protein [Sporocytophaga myxococcoides]|uniref:hypothetical protein n=1 Tax=Sporocytophaga myxococcoides TaxID=153721 RepID=UPI0004271CF1|nr:hypothetical protein [Sporocytophaga myxococcoides]